MRAQKAYCYCIVAILSLLTGGCLDPYDPPISEDKINYLIVDGFINTTTKTATVKLSQAIALSAREIFPYVQNANVTIEGEDGTTEGLTEKANGNYELNSSHFDNTKNYRLNIRLNDGKQYQSDYIKPLANPVIDSITWKPDPSGVTFFVNTHDDLNQTRFYKWNFIETWIYAAPLYSYFKFADGQPIFRTPDESINTCWGEEKSVNILVTSTLKLSKDIVRDFPVTSVAKGSRKISQLYSILVEQRSLDIQAFEYWEKLQKTTEALGGLFDPLPSQIIGNIKNVQDTAEPVLGYFSGGEVKQQRLYLKLLDLPDYLLAVTNSSPCEITSTPLAELKNNGQVLLESFGQPVVSGYTSTSYECADCRAHGGTTTKPDFWP